MAGGQKINDHSFYAGKGGKDSVLPNGVHTKTYTSTEGAGELNSYQDTTEAIKAKQEISKGKVKSYPANPQFI